MSDGQVGFTKENYTQDYGLMEDWQADGWLADCSLGSARQNLKDENMPQFIAGSNIKLETYSPASILPTLFYTLINSWCLSSF